MNQSNRFRPPSGVPSPYAPAPILLGLIRQSQRRYEAYREMARRLDEGFGQLQIDVQNLDIALAQYSDADGSRLLEASLDAALDDAAEGKRLLDGLMAHELHVQGGLKRWLMGIPPQPQGAGVAGAPGAAKGEVAAGVARTPPTPPAPAAPSAGGASDAGGTGAAGHRGAARADATVVPMHGSAGGPASTSTNGKR